MVTDLQPGVLVKQGPSGEAHYEYTHLLNPDLVGFRMWLRLYPKAKKFLVDVEGGRGNVGYMVGRWEIAGGVKLIPESAQVSDEWRSFGVAQSMHDAVLTHGSKVLHATHFVKGEEAVPELRAMALKYGLTYEPLGKTVRPTSMTLEGVEGKPLTGRDGKINAHDYSHLLPPELSQNYGITVTSVPSGTSFARIARKVPGEPHYNWPEVVMIPGHVMADEVEPHIGQLRDRKAAGAAVYGLQALLAHVRKHFGVKTIKVPVHTPAAANIIKRYVTMIGGQYEGKPVPNDFARIAREEQAAMEPYLTEPGHLMSGFDVMLKSDQQWESEALEKSVIHDNPNEPMTVWRIQNDVTGKGLYGNRDMGKPNWSWWEAANGPPDPEWGGVSDPSSPEMDFDRADYSDYLKHHPDVRFGLLKPEDALEWVDPHTYSLLVSPEGDSDGPEHWGRPGRIRLVPVKARKVWRSKSGRQVIYLPHEPQDLNKMALAFEIGKHGRQPVTVYRFENDKGQGPYQGMSLSLGSDYERRADAVKSPPPNVQVLARKGKTVREIPKEEAVESGLESEYNAGIDQPQLRLGLDQRGTPASMDYWSWWEAANRWGKNKPLFAFARPEDAVEWFGPHAITQMARSGFLLRAVPAAKVWLSSSGRQVIFHPHDTYKKGDPTRVVDVSGMVPKDNSRVPVPPEQDQWQPAKPKDIRKPFRRSEGTELAWELLGKSEYLEKAGVRYDRQTGKLDVPESMGVRLTRLPGYGVDRLADLVPERKTHTFALHPSRWTSTFWSLTNKDNHKVVHYGPKLVELPEGTLVADMAHANAFQRGEVGAAERYKASMRPLKGADLSAYKYPELLIPPGHPHHKSENTVWWMQDLRKDMADFTQEGDELGSNPGGTFRDQAGNRYYFKFQQTPEHARNEILAHKLYEAAGVPALDMRPLNLGDGRIGTGTKWVQAEPLNIADPEHLAQARKLFALHAWLGNWDHHVHGNMAMRDGRISAMDLGGALLFRARGEPKPNFGASVDEWDSLRQHDYKGFFKDMSPEELQESAKMVGAMDDAKIDSLVKEHGPGDDVQKARLAGILKARRQDVLRRANG